MSFEYNVITSDGAALIAQATSSNPIVFIGCLSSATAANSKEDLASKTRAFYTGKSGNIFSASAQGNMARIMMSFDNIGLQTSQVIKSACVLGKLYNQSDSEAVIVSALSDTNSQITIPDSTSPKIAIKIPINIKINAGDDIATVGAEYASLADLDRFMSIHKAGNPLEGENQDVYGEKVFKEVITTNGIESKAVLPDTWIYQNFNTDRFSIAPNRTHLSGAKSIGLYSEILKNDMRISLVSVEEGLFEDPIASKKAGSIELKVTEEGLDKSAYMTLSTSYNSFGNAESDVIISAQKATLKTDTELLMVSKSFARLVSSGNLSDPLNNPPCAELATRYDSSGNTAGVLFRVKQSTTEYGVNYAIYDNKPSLYPVQSGADLGANDNDNKWENVYANTFKGNLDGLIPTTGYTQNPVIGSIFLAHLEARASIGTKGIGQTVTNNEYAIRKAMLSLDSNSGVKVGFESAIVAITTGSYKLLSAIDGLSANEATVALVMRIS